MFTEEEKKQVPKLANLTQLRSHWKKAVMSELWRLLLVLMGIVALIFLFVNSHAADRGIAIPSWQIVLCGAGAGLVTLFMLVRVTAGPWPTQADVDANKALRRAFGLNDAVEGEEDHAQKIT